MGGSVSCCASPDSPPSDFVEVKDTIQKDEEKLEEPEPPVVEEPPPKVFVKGPIVKVVMARGLRNADWAWVPGQGVSDAYVVVSVGGKEVARTGVIKNTLEPIFNEEFETGEFEETTPEKIDFAIYDKDKFKTDDKLGYCSLSKDKYEKSGFNNEILLEDAGKGIQAFLKVMVKMPDKQYPAGASNEFKITLKKEKGASIGFEVDAADPAMLFICDGDFTGAAKAHNDKAVANLQLKKAQFIVEVNGVSGDSKKMIQEIKTKGEVALLVRRPMFFTIALDKKGPFGVVLGNAPTEAYVSSLVTDKETCIGKWNAAHLDKVVKVFDRIVSVNGKQGSGQEITDMLKTEGRKQAVICRPCDPKLTEAVYFSFFDRFF